MKGLVLFLFSLPFVVVAQADTIGDSVQSASQAYSDHLVQTMWKNRCSRPEALRTHANCYVNPEGVALWEMKGAEREKWKPVAVQESVRLQQEYRKNIEVAKEQGIRAAKETKIKSQMCDFWKQQADSNKKRERVEHYCM